jgi:predicted enzyme related to lactoylglutathione lyase
MPDSFATQFDLVTFDTPSTEILARFWADAMGLTESEREDGDRWIVLSDDNGVRRLGFQRGAHRPGGTHLDLVCSIDNFESEHRRFCALGATETRPVRRESYGMIANFLDPDGNAFDLCAYHS